ncbi:hypothetical protein BXZ70DRAFT_952980 [Cristinia sonorae]|uniref:F-box domain-containing protein n=1 Tax=Cristinia sonorae TaxID=1940300 RepID=A0A8K0UHB1_9AGAR|nr:hypothetical protein BXZ70DRAFT_952980 [Cristinia sonorae]
MMREAELREDSAEFYSDSQQIPEDEEVDDEEDDANDTDYNPANAGGRKRRRTQAKSTSGRKGTQTSRSEGQNTASVARKGKKSLSLLPTMPLDILFEIFSLLMPKDILSLSRTSKNFRQTLLARNATTVWKTARQRFLAPPCPSWMSEPAWTALLFENVCQSCGAKNVHNVDFLILRRACAGCKKSFLVVRSRLPKLFDGISHTMLAMVPFTDVGGWTHGRGTSSQYFWRSDVEAMVQQYAAHQDAIHSGKPDALQKFENFRNEQIERVDYIQKHAPNWAKWITEAQMQKYKDAAVVQEMRIQQIKDRFKQLGYDDNDLTFLDGSSESRNRSEITDKAWKRIRARYEPTAEEYRTDRLSREAAKIRFARVDIIQQRYMEFKKSIPPTQWKYLPRTLTVTLLQPFMDVITRDPSEELKLEEYDALFVQLPGLLNDWSEERQAELTKSMVDANVVHNPTQLDSPSSNQLSLARTVFRCSSPYYMCERDPYLFGWDDIAVHHCMHDNYINFWGVIGTYTHAHRYGLSLTFPVEMKGYKLVYDPSVVKIAEKVVAWSGLDPMTATTEQVHEKLRQTRFDCKKCPSFEEQGVLYRFGYNWRRLVGHLAENYNHNPDAEFSAISPEATAEIQQCEDVQMQSVWDQRGWACVHCTVHAETLGTRYAVLQHVTDVHGIAHPLEEVDFVRVKDLRPYSGTRDIRFRVQAPESTEVQQHE